jgi:hypothetical protein
MKAIQFGGMTHYTGPNKDINQFLQQKTIAPDHEMRAKIACADEGLYLSGQDLIKAAETHFKVAAPIGFEDPVREKRTLEQVAHFPLEDKNLFWDQTNASFYKRLNNAVKKLGLTDTQKRALMLDYYREMAVKNKGLDAYGMPIKEVTLPQKSTCMEALAFPFFAAKFLFQLIFCQPNDLIPGRVSPSDSNDPPPPLHRTLSVIPEDLER